MGSSRFLKSIKARHRAGALVIKVFVKVDSHMDLRPTSKRIAGESYALKPVLFNTLRQYFRSSQPNELLSPTVQTCFHIVKHSPLNAQAI
jgi:hypothetical protein